MSLWSISRCLITSAKVSASDKGVSGCLLIQVFTLTVMSADRYLAVCYAIESRRYRTPAHSRAVCVAVWVASLLVMTPIYFYSKCDFSVISHQ